LVRTVKHARTHQICSTLTGVQLGVNNPRGFCQQFTDFSWSFCNIYPAQHLKSVAAIERGFLHPVPWRHRRLNGWGDDEKYAHWNA
jgi:hypothetical protein